MLQVTPYGVCIRLLGVKQNQTSGVFWFGFALLICAVAVALALSVLPMRAALLALAALIVGCYVFNRLRARLNHVQVLRGGYVHIKAHAVLHTNTQTIDSQDWITLPKSASIQSCDRSVQVIVEQQPVLHIKGFETKKEAEVAFAVLSGTQTRKQLINVKMKST